MPDITSMADFRVNRFWDDDTDNAGTWLGEEGFPSLTEARARADEIALGGEKAVISKDGETIFTEE